MVAWSKIAYWLRSAENDWTVAAHLLEKKDYAYALFFGHMTLEKLLKAVFVAVKNDTPPLTHRLVFLAEAADLTLDDEQLELLEIVTDFNLEARYPDERFSFQKRCTHEFTVGYLKRIEEMRTWLLRKISSSKT